MTDPDYGTLERMKRLHAEALAEMAANERAHQARMALLSKYAAAPRPRWYARLWTWLTRGR